MNEVEKMYKLANVQPQYKKRIECKEGHSIGLPCGKSPCIDCDKSVFEDVMPPFTTEKQLNLILCLSKRGIKFNRHSISSGYLLSKNKRKTSMRVGYKADNFPDLLSQHINYIWQDLTEEEKQQIKEILERFR